MPDEATWTVEVAPVQGRCDALPDERGCVIHFQGSQQPTAVAVNDVGTKNWTYNPETLTTSVYVEKRDKRQSLAVTIWNRNGISALGEAHNQAMVHSDLWHLLGKDWAQDIEDVDAVLHADVPGRLDAIARLGGPFVRFVEFTTPEETAQQLGRVIVGAPEDGSYDLSVTFTLFRGGADQAHTVEVEGTTETQIVDSAFAFDGKVQTQRWEAKVKVTWRGQTLTWAHRSQPLFPTIHAWRAVVYDREKEPLSLDGVMEEEGALDGEQEWIPFVQTADGLRNVNQPHGAMFWRTHREQLRAGHKLAAYVATTVTSPDERDAVLHFRAGGSYRIYLNGQEVKEVPLPEDKETPIYYREHRTTVVRLRAGENTLLVDSRPPDEGRPIWFFGGMFTAEGEDEEPMADLAFN
jgi:hypothetical protein